MTYATPLSRCIQYTAIKNECQHSDENFLFNPILIYVLTLSLLFGILYTDKQRC